MVNMRFLVSRELVPSYSRVECQTEQDHYWQKLLCLSEARGRRCLQDGFFPCCNPRGLQKKNLSTLAKHKYMVGLKTDGVFYALLLTTRPGNAQSPVALLINRARVMYEVDVVAKDEFFIYGTVLHGELAWRQPDEHSLDYVAFDILCNKGCAKVATLPFHMRLAELRSILFTTEDEATESGGIACVHVDPPLSATVKQFIPREHVVDMWGKRATHSYRTDGIILQRNDTPIRFGASQTEIFKWKPHCTVDLAGPTDKLRTQDGPLPSSILDIKLLVGTVDERLKCVGDEVAEYILEGSKQGITVRILRKRPDKTVANSLVVVERCVQEMLEGICIDQIE